MPNCPECRSQRVWKDGLRYTKKGKVQRWLCRKCGFRFSESLKKSHKKVDILNQTRRSQPGSYLAETSMRSSDLAAQKLFNDFPLPLGKDVGSHDVTIVGKSLNNLCSYHSKRQVCVTKKEARNLAKVESQTKTVAGATEKPATEEMKGRIVEHLWWLQKEGYAEATIKTRITHLKTMMKRGANLFDQDSVKETIAKSPVDVNTKIGYVTAYATFAIMLDIPFQPPRYKQQKRLPWVPLESEVDLLIGCCSKKMGAFLQLLKETGMRPGEACKLEWTDTNSKNNTVTLNKPEKGSNPRIYNVSNRCMSMIQQLPKKSLRIFGDTLLRIHRTNFRAQRKRVAEKTGNPRILKITFQRLRHLKGTIEYHQTKDILHVMRVLGHKNVNNTLVYIDLEHAIFQSGNDDFIVKVAENTSEVCKLLEVGFDYVGNIHGKEVFRKRK